MMKLPKMPEAEESQSMSAMIDVVFLLLIFFIVTMSAYVETTLLETKLPTDATGSAAPNLANVVRIDIPAPQEEHYFYVINGTPQSAAQINRLLDRYQRLMPEAEFLINCAPTSEHHQLVKLLADCSRHNLKNLKLLKSQ
jgi:biopolymer transport protein ExbD